MPDNEKKSIYLQDIEPKHAAPKKKPTVKKSVVKKSVEPEHAEKKPKVRKSVVKAAPGEVNREAVTEAPKSAPVKKAKSKKKKNKKKIWISRIIFLVLLLAMVIPSYIYGTKYLTEYEAYLTDYEKSRPTEIMDNYMAGLTQDKFRELYSSTLDKVDTTLQSKDDCFNYIMQQVGTDLHYAPTPENPLVYAIYNNEMTLGEVTLSEDTSGEYSTYTVASESYDFSHIFHKIEITAPNAYVVKLGDNVVPDSYITNDNVEYKYLHNMYRVNAVLPCMRTYTAENIFGDAEFYMEDYAGNRMNIDSVGDGREFFSIPDENTVYNISRIATAFTNDMVYVSCGFGGSVAAYAAPGAEILSRAAMLGTSAYYHTQGAYITNFVVNGVYALGNNLYICDVSFHTQGHTYYSVADYDHNYKYLFDDSSGMMGIRIVQGYTN